MKFSYLIGTEATRRRALRGGMVALAAALTTIAFVPGTAMAIPVMISAAPADPSNSNAAVFHFSDLGDPSRIDFECTLNGPVTITAEPCTSPKSYVPLDLPEGQYNFIVSIPGTSDSAPPHDWTIDNTPPGVTIDPASGPSGNVSSDSAQFAFSASDANGVTVICTLDGQSSESCTDSSPLYTGLTHGLHTFTVQATDGAGNVNNDSRSWTVDLVGPAASIDSGPSGTVDSTAATFAFSSPEPDATFECRIDSSGWIPCTSSTLVSNLGEGPHTFAVRARDALGNYGAEAARSFTVELPRHFSVGPSAKPLSSLVLISGRTVKISKSRFASVFLNCSGTKECAGRLILASAKPVRVRKKRKRVVRLGSTKFRIAAARTKKVRVRLSKQKIRLVRRMKRLKTDVIVRDLDGAGRARLSTRTIVLRAPR